MAEVYAGLPSSTGEPPKRLIGYVKKTLAAGQRLKVTITIDPAGPSHPFRPAPSA